MTDKVMEFLVASGGGSLDELVARVPDDPQRIANSLSQLAQKKYIKTEGSKNIRDFYSLVAKVVESRDGKNGTKEQRRWVLEEILQRQKGFMDTIVRPTTLGLTFGLR
jgi:hypothetical protein